MVTILKVLNYDLTLLTIDNFFSLTYPLLQMYYGKNLKFGKSQKCSSKTLGAYDKCLDKILKNSIHWKKIIFEYDQIIINN